MPRSTTLVGRADPAPSPAVFELALSPAGAFYLHAALGGEAIAVVLPARTAERIRQAFAASPAEGLLHLASVELTTALPASLGFGREVGKLFFTTLCRQPGLDEKKKSVAGLPVPVDDFARLIDGAPPMIGAEYLPGVALADVWAEMERVTSAELSASGGTAQELLARKSAAYGVVGRVCFHIAENKADPEAPFAFLATYATRLSKQGRVQHAPLGRAIEESAGKKSRAELVLLLAPVQRAAEKSAAVKRLVDSGEVFHPVALRPDEALALLRDVPAIEESGVVLRLPDWWNARRPPRPEVRVTLGTKSPSGLGTDALLDFDVRMTLDGETLTPAEWKALLAGADGLRLLRGRWVEVDKEKLREVLDHWKRVERATAEEGISFLQGMRMLAGAGLPGDAAPSPVGEQGASWARVEAGVWLDDLLMKLRRPEGAPEADPGAELNASLRPYQREGVAWLRLLSRLGLGACLADDMGLGKTIQVLALILLLRQHREPGPHLVVAPASLLGNWRAEIARFAPSLRVLTAHPSDPDAGRGGAEPPAGLAGCDLVLSTYGTVLRWPWLSATRWGLVVLDEAQAIKNPGAKQTRAVKALQSRTRVALTGTPVENRLSDLWSLFDFLCPGLLGTASAFRQFAKTLETEAGASYAPLRNLVRPYILRRMKSDPRVAPDLPDKTEVVAYCALTKTQAALYEDSVRALGQALESAEGIARRGLVLAYLMRFKQICNHPSQWLGDGAFGPESSGKFARLAELCEPIAARQERVLVFTQFREMTEPLARFLAEVFRRPGLILHGQTPVARRAGLVADFQRDGGPPFFVVSLKAGGTGLNLTAASHVVHFDRWWNPAVEAQATDRAYRIGQHRNVVVHKFVCRGTVEEKIDRMIEGKRAMSEEILSGGGEAWLTELPSDEILRLVSLDLRAATEAG